MNVYLPNKRLPNTYQEVEYIESNGTQAINTGVINQWNTLNVYMKFLVTYLIPSREDGFFGAKGSSTQSPVIFAPETGTKTLNSWFGSGTTYSITSSAISTNIIHILDMTHTTTQRYGTFDGTSFSKTQSVSNSANNTNGYMCFFSDGSTPQQHSYMRLYSAKITVNGILVRDFVPCYRKSDNVIGMYDLVNSVFYTNSGTGTFSKGNDVTMTELKNAYIGEVWTPGANTLLYRPLTENANDYSGNNRNGTPYASVSFTQDGAYFSGSNYTTNFIDFPSSFYPGTSFTISLRIKRGENNKELRMFSDWGPNYRRILWYMGNSGYVSLLFGNGNTSQSDWGSIQTYSANTRYNYVLVKNGTSASIYRNGVLVGTHTFSYNSAPGGLALGEYGIGDVRTATTSTYVGTGYIKDYIIENKLWTAQEISHYYDITKSNYGL